MQGNAKSVFSIFTENNRFIVPLYQRPYSWKVEQCRQLWDDIVACAIGKRAKHFFGSTVRVPDASGMIVIDGQQRITTISLLMMAIRHILMDGGRSATRGGKTQDWILNEFLLERCYPPRMDAKKLLLVHGDADCYAKLMESPSECGESRLKDNFDFFFGQVSSMPYSVDTLLGAIEKLIVIDISIDPVDEPQLVFESINSTGLDLTEGDKIRNFILMGLSNEKQTIYYQHYWRPIESLTKRDDPDADGVGLFIRDVLTTLRSEIPGLKVIYPEFKRFWLEKTGRGCEVEAALKALLEYARCYDLLLRPEKIGQKNIAAMMCNINRQECLPAYPFLVELFHLWKTGALKEDQIEKCLRTVDAFVLRRLICDLPTNSLNKIFTDLHKAILGLQEGEAARGVPYEELLAFVLESKSGKARFPTDSEFRQCMIERHVYELRTKNRAYLFSRLEHGTSKTAATHGVVDPVFNNIADKTYTVEHVMPQTLNNAWRTELGPNADAIHETWLHRLGNLTLTAYNSDMGNGAFASKKGRSLAELKADNFGFSCEAHHLFLTEFISQQEHWTAREMLKRSELLANRALEVWPYPKTTFRPPEPTRYTYKLTEKSLRFFIGSKPLGFKFRGEEFTADTWHSIVEQVITCLVKVNPDALRQSAAESTTIRLSTIEQPSLTSEKIVDGVFVCCGGSVWDKCNVMKQALRHFPDDDVEIFFSSEIEGDDD